MWNKIIKHGPLARLVLVISGVGVLVTGVTFAALQSQQVMLTGNTIQTATAGLLIGTASATSSAYSASHSGFTFKDIIPGGPATPGNSNVFYLKNSGSASLALKMSIGSTPTNTANVDLTKVFVNVTRTDTGTTQSASLQSLIDGYPTGGMSFTDPLNPATTGVQYTIAVVMSQDAFTGTTASIGAIDFVFSGVVATPPTA